ncbi:hypothetical protein C7212DRAFT_367248 [Tuber magnatum]|uniref:Uncharacterized protein n=1 Tax=Tuber magnatum TaxID=42249 RepID=A0A317SAK6_9PEZI|nr:hypothetical protein C7212DRAFT_367248 [Tuber magnatum]
MEDIVYTTGGYRITIRTSDPEHGSGRRHRHHREGEDARTHHRQPHYSTYSQYPPSGEYAEGQNYPRLTTENLASHERRERGDRIHRGYGRHEDDTAAQCGERYPEERRHRRNRSDGAAHARSDRPTQYAAHHGRGQEPELYQAGYGHAAGGRRSTGGYANVSYVQTHCYGDGYPRQHTYHATYRQSDRPVLGEETFGPGYPYGEGGATRRRTGGSSQARYAPEWMSHREDLRGVEEKSEDGSIQCEIEEVD